MHDDYDYDGRESGTGTIIGVLILSSIIVAGAVGLMWYLQGPYVGRKMLVYLAAPIGMIWLVFFLFAMTATFTKQKFLACVSWLCVVALSTIGNNSFSNGMMESLERGNSRYEFKENESFDYGFVLGGSYSFKKNDEIDFNGANERVLEAVHLYREGKIKHLVLCGAPFLQHLDKKFDGDEPKKQDPSDEKDDENSIDKNLDLLNGPAKGEKEVGQRGSQAPPLTLAHHRIQESDAKQEEDKQETDKKSVEQKKESDESKSGDSGEMELEVTDQDEEKKTSKNSDGKQDTEGKIEDDQTPIEKTLLLKKLAALGVKENDVTFLSGRTTHEEIFRIDEFLKDKPDAKCALITSAWHMNRAEKLSQKQARSLTPIPVDFRSGNQKKDPIFFIPNTGAFQESSLAIKEIIASWF